MRASAVARNGSVRHDGPMPQKLPPKLSLTRAVQTFQMLGDGTRLRIAILLGQKSVLTGPQLCEFLGQSQPATSHHLALLRRFGLVRIRREGKNNFYFLASTQARQWIRSIKF
jgi:DNA-binding transcriptional ArsR family regulator